MSRIYISYKRADLAQVLPLKRRIEEEIGEACWMNMDVLLNGSAADVITHVIDKAQVFLFMYSRSFAAIEDFSADQNIRELEYANKNGKRIVFINVDQAPVSMFFEFMFSSHQLVDASNETELNYLLKDLRFWLANDDLWVFISHSTKDFERVRIVRNALEEKGYRPILLYLKCMDDDAEIDSLLKREIDARRWFILCDSSNARNSKYVQSEVNYIRAKHRTYDIIDVNRVKADSPNMEKEVLSLLRPFQQKRTVYLNYSRADASFAHQLAEQLRLLGYTVLSPRNLMPADDYAKGIQELIQQAGIFIALVSNRWRKSDCCQAEFEYAMRSCPDTNVLPVVIEDMDDGGLCFFTEAFGKVQVLDVSSLSSVENKTEAIIGKLTPNQ